MVSLEFFLKQYIIPIIEFVTRSEVNEEVDSVKEFSSELIVEAVVKCIQVINPGLGSTLPTSLPPGMSARFRVGMSLAQACQVSPRLWSQL